MPETETIDATDLPPLKTGAGGLGIGQPVAEPAPGTDTDSPISAIQRQSSGLTGPSGSLTYNALRRSAASDAADAKLNERLDRDRAERERAYKAEAAGPDTLPPKWDADAERAKRSHGPIESFGSVGVIFALAASAFTKTPMTSALNAAAGAMEAIKAGDEQKYKDAYTAWKDNTELALKRFHMERELFEDANKLATTDIADWRTKQLQIAARYDNQKVMAMLDAGMDKDVIDIQNAQIKGAAEMEKAKDQFEDFNNKYQIMEAEKKAFMDQNGITDPKDLRVIHHALQVKQALNEPATSEQQSLMKDFRNEYWQTNHRMPSSEEEIKAWQQIQQVSSRSNEVDRRTQTYETDPNSPTFGDHAASYDRAAKEVGSAKQSGTTLSPEAIDSAARTYVKTGKMPPNLGRGTQGAANVTAIQNRVAEVMKEEGKTPEQVAEGQRGFQTRAAGLRALETRRGRLLSSIYATDEMGDLLKQASDAAPRSQFTILNKGTQAIEATTSDPKLARFVAAINSYVNTYAQAISGGGQSRIGDKEHAYEMINKAMGTGAIDAVIEQLHKETRAEMRSTRKALQELSTEDEPGSDVDDKPSGSHAVTPGGGVSGVTPSGISYTVQP